ncbi:MAG: FAD-dependent oxidoreductase, partial [Maribacter sp.]
MQKNKFSLHRKVQHESGPKGNHLVDNTMDKKSRIIICGAGIAGVASAYYLLKKEKGITVILIDKNQPLSFTTSKSGENFRDYWPQKPMRDFVSDSIHLMNEL